LWAVGERWTVSALLQRFEDAPGHASPVTLDSRSRIVAAVRADHLGAVRLGRLSPLVLSDTVRRWQAAGLCATGVRARVNLVRSAVTWAVGQGMLAGDVLAGVRGVPDGEPRTHTPISVVREVLSIARHDVVRAQDMLALRSNSPAAVSSFFRAQQYMLLAYVVADTGLRRGELAGLRSDDLLGRVLWIERAVKPGRGGIVIGPPKTYKAGRITISTATARLWRHYLSDWFGPSVVSGVDTVWLFAVRPRASRPVHPATLADRFARIADRARGPGGAVSLHRVRHTVATTLVSLGKFDHAQRRLRHSRLDTTLRNYVDTTGVGDDTDVADELERFYRGGTNPLNAIADL
jgi:integrase